MQKIIFILSGFFILLSCERKTADQNSKIVISIPNYTSERLSIMASGAAPSIWSEIDCYGFMISYPDTASNPNSCEQFSGSSGAKLNSLFFGSLHAGYSKGVSAELDVAAGKDRVIHAIGFKSNVADIAQSILACSNVLKSDNASFSKPFLVSSSEKFEIAPGVTKNVELPINYIANMTSFFGDCSGPTAPGSGGAVAKGPPVKLRIRIQDNLTSVNQHACIGVVAELLDANNQQALITEDFAFSINSSGNEIQSPTGNFCDLTVPGPFNAQFFSGGSRFSNINLLVKPMLSGILLSFAITQTQGTVLITEYPTVSIEASISPNSNPNSPFQMQILDVYSIKTTRFSGPSNPIEVKLDECRPAIVQIIDSLGRPVEADNQSSVMQDFITVVENGIGSSVLFDTAADCMTGSVVGNSRVSLYGTSQNKTGLNRFYYKVPPAMANSIFSLKVTKTGAGDFSTSNPLINLDVTGATNNKSYFKAK